MDARIAIVNRGEPARRLIHAARELNHERRWGLRTVALHTAEEAHATFVREADEAVLIGRGTAGNPYIDHGELERALRGRRADFAWVGWGFVAEDPAFAELCERIGVTFIGPPPDAMRRLGDKIAAKLLAEEVGVPVAAWSGGPVATDEEARRHAEAIGFPLMIKAAAGGGGRGIRIVESAGELGSALQRARGEAQRAFGDASVLMERLVRGARHVEVQVVADGHGNGWAVGVRDCSVQRRSQKLIEESASPVLPPDLDETMRRSSVDLVLAAGYRNVGTVEFLFQPAERTLAFLEVNTRLQTARTHARGIRLPRRHPVVLLGRVERAGGGLGAEERTAVVDRAALRDWPTMGRTPGDRFTGFALWTVIFEAPRGCCGCRRGAI